MYFSTLLQFAISHRLTMPCSLSLCVHGSAGTWCALACRPRGWRASTSFICVFGSTSLPRPLCCTVVTLSSGYLAPVPGCLSTLTLEADLRPPLTSGRELAICPGNNSESDFLRGIVPRNALTFCGHSHVQLKEYASYLFFKIGWMVNF